MHDSSAGSASDPRSVEGVSRIAGGGGHRQVEWLKDSRSESGQFATPEGMEPATLHHSAAELNSLQATSCLLTCNVSPRELGGKTLSGRPGEESRPLTAKTGPSVQRPATPRHSCVGEGALPGKLPPQEPEGKAQRDSATAGLTGAPTAATTEPPGEPSRTSGGLRVVYYRTRMLGTSVAPHAFCRLYKATCLLSPL